jgi:hypothetical protein
VHITNYDTGWQYPGDLSIYKKARGYPNDYTIEDFYHFYNCAYDGSGNVYTDGEFSYYAQHFEFAVLPNKSNTLEALSLPTNVNFAGGVAWTASTSP